jgi:dTDP-4-amino-4,6-dideoxygalactose transaminase
MSKKKIINYSSHYIDSHDIEEVQKVLKSGYLTQGPLLEKFEKKLEKHFVVRHAVSCSSGTAAIHLAMLSLNIKKNDIILMPVTNFISAYNISYFIGCKIYYVDVDKFTGLITSKNILDCIKKNNLKKIDLVFVMHHGGQVCNLEEINVIKKKFKFKIIEDACHAVGSKYLYKKKIFKVGCSKHSDITVFSFHPIKTITTLEGGALLTNNKNIEKKAKLIRSHGIKRSKFHWDYNVITNGFNYRLNEIGCSLGITQLSKINNFLKKRREIASIYFDLLKNYKNFILLPDPKLINLSSWHLFNVSINFKKFKTTKYDLFKFMKKNRINLQQHYIPINLFKATKNCKNLIGSNFFFKNSFTLPIYFKITKNDQKKIIKKLINFLLKNKKNKDLL